MKDDEQRRAYPFRTSTSRCPGTARHQQQRPYLRRLGIVANGYRWRNRGGKYGASPVATVAIDAMEFIQPILVSDVISIYAHVEKRGRTSMGIRIEVVSTRDRGKTHVKVTEALFTFVAIDENHRPRPLPDNA